MADAEAISFKIDLETRNTLDTLAAKKHIGRSALIRRLIDVGLEKELAAESVDFVRGQLREEIKSCCGPQFNRIAKLEAKIGYQSVANFYLLAYIMDSILPVSKQVDFNEIKRNAKAMAIAYLKLDETEFAEFMKSEDMALEKLDLQ